jgi:hypothetical protein
MGDLVQVGFEKLPVALEMEGLGLPAQRPCRLYQYKSVHSFVEKCQAEPEQVNFIIK